MLNQARGQDPMRQLQTVNQWLNRVRYVGQGANARFVTVGDGGVAFWSANGSSGWTSLNTGTTNDLLDAVQNDLGLLLVGDGELRFQAAGTGMWANAVIDAPTNPPPAWVYISAASPGTNRRTCDSSACGR